MEEITIPNEEEINIELDINNSSIFNLEKELKEHPKKEAKYVRWAASASKVVALLELELSIVSAQIIADICNTQKIPPSAITEVRRSKVPAYSTYQEAKKKVILAQENANILNGLVSAWVSRGYRLQELVKLSDRIMYPDKRVYEERIDRKLSKMEENLED